MKRLIWFTGSSGLDTELDPVRHKYNPETGVLPARIALNVDVDKSGRISRRKGWEYTDITGECHSLFCDGGDAFYVSGNALILLAPDMSTSNLRNVTVNAPMSYVQIGSRTFYTNGSENGFILNGTSYGWNVAVPNQKDSTVVYSPPPLGSLIGYHKGRMYVVQHYIVWYSEANNLNTFNLKEYLPFSSNVTMWSGVSKGVWVGTENQILFLRGDSPKEFKQERKALVGCIKGSSCYIDCTSIIGLVDQYGYQISGVGVIFLSPSGIYLGTDDGTLIQISRGKVTIPNTIFGTGIVIGDRYVASLGDSLYSTRLTVSEQVVLSAISQYKNYSFNSFAKIGTEYYGANGSGIFKLDAANNDKVSSSSSTHIEAYYESALTDFGVDAEKRIRKCNSTLEANGEVKFSFKSNERQEAVQHIVPAFTDNTQHAVEIPVGRDTMGRYYSFVIENLGGADFSLDNLEAFVEVLTRRPEKKGSY